MPNKNLLEGHDIVRAGKFGVVGGINTLLDFTVFNLLTSVAKLTLIQANIVSTTVAMIFSFTANKQLVFKSAERSHKSVLRQAVTFFLVTAFGLYVLQTGVIKLLTEVWLGPIALGLTIAHMLGITSHDQFLAKNAAKGVATVVSLAWNYVMYKKVVFS